MLLQYGFPIWHSALDPGAVARHITANLLHEGRDVRNWFERRHAARLVFTCFNCTAPCPTAAHNHRSGTVAPRPAPRRASNGSKLGLMVTGPGNWRCAVPRLEERRAVMNVVYIVPRGSPWELCSPFPAMYTPYLSYAALDMNVIKKATLSTPILHLDHSSSLNLSCSRCGPASSRSWRWRAHEASLPRCTSEYDCTVCLCSAPCLICDDERTALCCCPLPPKCTDWWLLAVLITDIHSSSGLVFPDCARQCFNYGVLPCRNAPTAQEEVDCQCRVLVLAQDNLDCFARSVTTRGMQADGLRRCVDSEINPLIDFCDTNTYGTSNTTETTTTIETSTTNTETIASTTSTSTSETESATAGLVAHGDSAGTQKSGNATHAAAIGAGVVSLKRT